MNFENELRSFVKRIRRAYVWKGAAAGLFFGAVATVLAAAGDYLGWIWIEWPWLFIGPLLGLTLGALIGFFKRPSLEQVAASVDRRASLRDRVASGMEIGGTEHPFAADVHEDALASLSSLDPKRLYPIGYLRWHSFALIALVLAGGIALLGNTPVLASPAERKEKEELKQQAEDIQKVVKPVLDKKDLSPMSKDYAKELERFARELERARHDRKEALKKSNELLDKGADLNKKLEQNLDRSLENAQKTLEAMMAEALKKEGQEASPEELRQHLENMLNASRPEYDQALQQGADRRNELNAQKADLNSRMTDLRRQLDDKSLSQDARNALEQSLRELQEQMRQLEEEMAGLNKELADLDRKLRDQVGKDLMGQSDFEKKMAELQEKLRDIQSKMKQPNLTDAQRKALEKRMKEIQEAMKQLKMSKELEDGLRKLYNDPKMREIMERMAELMQKAKFAEGGEPGDMPDMPKITKEQIEEMQKALDELAKQLADDDVRKKLLDDLKKALDELDELVLGQGMCMGFGMCMGLMPGMGMGMPGVGGPSHGGVFSGVPWVSKLDKGVKGEGKTLPSRVTGERHPTLGNESFIEVKGPARLGKPSQIPYLKLLPKYQQAAEEAMKKQKVPKDQEKRVRDYFRSIGGQ